MTQEVWNLFLKNVVDLPVNMSLSYFWCGGFVLGFVLFLQLVSGVVLSCLFSVGIDSSFACSVGLLSEGLFLWLLRYVHIWGVNYIFFFIFLHMGRSLYYSSYLKYGVWNVGFVLYLVMMFEAFLGYVLPWHQMSYWAATVLTSVLESIPFFGGLIYSYVVGGFSVTGGTLVRVYPIHVCLAFVIVGLSLVHMFYLHRSGSNNPLVVGGGYSDVVWFHKYYTLKDGFVVSGVFFTFVLLMWYVPDCLVDSESYIRADFMVTPSSIKPEWYFLMFYAMLRSVESKLGGLVLVLVFLFLLWLPAWNFSCVYSLGRQFVFWWLVALFFVLTYIGSCHPELPYSLVGKVSSFAVIVFLMAFKGLWVGPYSYFGVFRWLGSCR